WPVCAPSGTAALLATDGGQALRARAIPSCRSISGCSVPAAGWLEWAAVDALTRIRAASANKRTRGARHFQAVDILKSVVMISSGFGVRAVRLSKRAARRFASRDCRDELQPRPEAVLHSRPT